MPSSKLVGTNPDQCPTNADLGTLAFQDENNVNIGGGNVVANIYSDTAISEIKPSLLLDFANGKTLDPRITFSRASTATYYDGRTTAMAEQNILYNTTDLANASWLKTNINLVANAGIAPDNTQTAAYAAMTTTSGYHYYYAGGSQVSMSIPNGTATYSIYVKPNGYTKYGFREGASTGRVITFDTATTSVLYTTDSASTSGSVVSVGNGWYRISATFTGLTVQRYEFWMLSSSYTTGDLLVNWAGDGTSGAYLWGPQCEMRSGASAYTPVTGTNAVTNYIPALQTAGVGAPRFDHDPITGESKGLLIEEQRTNLIWAIATPWVNGNCTALQAATISPSGALDATLATATTAGSYAGISYSNTATSGSTYTFSVFLKRGSSKYVWIGEGAGAWDRVLFDLDAGKSVASDGLVTNSGITAVGNGWYRVFISVAAITTSWQPWIGFGSAASIGGYSIGDSFYAWGAQVEAGAFPTSYIPTTSAQVTRSADTASMTGTNFSSWYNQAEGTLYVQGSSSSQQTGTYRGYVSIVSDSSNGLGIYQAITAGTTAEITVAGSQLGSFAAFPYTNNTVVSATLGYKTNDSGFAVNGVGANTDVTVPSIPQVNQMLIGAHRTASNTLACGTIKKIAYYPKRLADAELQEMTS